MSPDTPAASGTIKMTFKCSYWTRARSEGQGKLLKVEPRTRAGERMHLLPLVELPVRFIENHRAHWAFYSEAQTAPGSLCEVGGECHSPRLKSTSFLIAGYCTLRHGLQKYPNYIYILWWGIEQFSEGRGNLFFYFCFCFSYSFCTNLLDKINM